MTAKPSFDQFRLALMYGDQRDALGMKISSAKLAELVSDESKARAFYESWNPGAPIDRRTVAVKAAAAENPDMKSMRSRSAKVFSVLMVIPIVAITALVLVVAGTAVYRTWIDPPQPGEPQANILDDVFKILAGDGVALNTLYEDVVYADCQAVVDAGAAPLYEADKGYEERLDPNNDGIACDPESGEAPPPSDAPPAEPAPAEPVPDEPAPPAGPSYANCDEVRAAGAAPITPADPGWDESFDADGDGIGCD